MTDRLDKSFLDDALQYASQETRYHVADSLACHLHNEGYALEGNTEANDVEWFARNVWDREHEHASGGWDRVPAETQERYREIARKVIDVLPAFQLRIAHRLITLSKVVRDIERAEREQRKQLLAERARR